MATSDQVKALIVSHFNGDNEHFASIVKQIAAHAAKKNQKRLSEELLDLLSEYQTRNSNSTPRNSQPTPALLSDAGELVILMQNQIDLHDDLVLSDETRHAIAAILKEHECADKLTQYGLVPTRRILLTGPPGTGKTSTAQALARELDMPFYLVRFDKLFTKYMGETASKLRILFDGIRSTKGVFLFDEVDAVATERAHGDDVGEARRVVNSLLQFLEEDTGESIIIAATNHPDMLDSAFPRRFELTITYENPTTQHQRKCLIAQQLRKMDPCFFAGCIPDETAILAESMSHAEIKQSVTAAMKKAVFCNDVENVIQHVGPEFKRRNPNQKDKQ